MSWIAAGAASAAATVAGVQYIKSKRDAKRDKENRPEYEIPEEVQQGLDKAKADALYGLPEAQKRQAEESFRAQQAYSLSSTKDRKGGLANVPEMDQAAGRFYSNMAAQDSIAKERKQGNVFGQLQNKANYADQQLQFNEISPYFEDIASRNARDGALAQNLSNSTQMMSYSSMGSGAKSGGGSAPTTGGTPATGGAPYQAPVVYSNTNSYGKSGVASTPNPYVNQPEFNPNPTYGGGGYYNI